jgi:hypothetical protein
MQCNVSSRQESFVASLVSRTVFVSSPEYSLHSIKFSRELKPGSFTNIYFVISTHRSFFHPSAKYDHQSPPPEPLHLYIAWHTLSLFLLSSAAP